MARTSRRRTSRRGVRGNGLFDWLRPKPKPPWRDRPRPKPSESSERCGWPTISKRGMTEERLDRKPAPARRYEFDNGYGASVICLSGAIDSQLYDERPNSFELMPLILDSWNANAPTTVGDQEKINSLLAKISSLPPAPQGAQIRAQSVLSWIDYASHGNFVDTEAERLLSEYDDEQRERAEADYGFGPPAVDRDERQTWPGHGSPLSRNRFDSRDPAYMLGRAAFSRGASGAPASDAEFWGGSARDAAGAIDSWRVGYRDAKEGRRVAPNARDYSYATLPKPALVQLIHDYLVAPSKQNYEEFRDDVVDDIGYDRFRDLQNEAFKRIGSRSSAVQRNARLKAGTDLDIRKSIAIVRSKRPREQDGFLPPHAFRAIANDGPGWYSYGSGRKTSNVIRKFKTEDLGGAMTSTRIAATKSGEYHWLVDNHSHYPVVIRIFDEHGKSVFRVEEYAQKLTGVEVPVEVKRTRARVTSR